MVFVQFLKSLDELLFELVSWFVFFPITLARVLRRPLAMMIHAEAELAKPTEEQFDDALSPPVFLVLAVILSHAAEVAVLGPDAVVASKRGLAALVDDNTTLLLLRLAMFGTYPLVMALNMVRKEGRHVGRSTLQGPFYAQCLLAAPLVLAFGLAFILLSQGAAAAKVGGMAVFLLSLATYGAVQATWFARRLSRPLGRGFLYASAAMVEALAVVAAIGFLFKA